MKKSRAITSYWKTQLPVDYIDTSLVQNTWENVSADLSGGVPVRLWFIIVEQTNNGATAEDIELEMTINGTAYTVAVTADDSTQYFVSVSYSLTAGDFSFLAGTQKGLVGSGVIDIRSAVPFIASSVELIRVRQTTDVDGTSAQIEVNIVWDKLTRIS